MDIEYCKECLECIHSTELNVPMKVCRYHDWFGTPETSNEILKRSLEKIHLYSLQVILEKCYVIEHVLTNSNEFLRDYYYAGEIIFNVEMPTFHKRDKYYIPVSTYSPMIEGIIDYQYEVKVCLIRHNPITLDVRESIFDGRLIYSIELLKDYDYLHLESIEDYPKILSLTKERLKKFIDGIK